jgi:hypothetical protein
MKTHTDNDDIQNRQASGLQESLAYPILDS